MNRKLTLSGEDKKIAGVCGGMAEYLGIDSTIIRLAFFASIFLHGFGLVVYAAAWLAMPKKQLASPTSQNY